MAEVRIPFLPEFCARMVNGEKTCTSRTKKYGKSGDTFGAFGKTFIITRRVEAKTLADVGARLFQEEGFKTPRQFVDVWNRLHPQKGFTPNKMVYVHHFRLLQDGDKVPELALQTVFDMPRQRRSHYDN